MILQLLTFFSLAIFISDVEVIDFTPFLSTISFFFLKPYLKTLRKCVGLYSHKSHLFGKLQLTQSCTLSWPLNKHGWALRGTGGESEGPDFGRMGWSSAGMRNIGGPWGPVHWRHRSQGKIGSIDLKTETWHNGS